MTTVAGTVITVDKTAGHGVNYGTPIAPGVLGARLGNGDEPGGERQNLRGRNSAFLLSAWSVQA